MNPYESPEPIDDEDCYCSCKGEPICAALCIIGLSVVVAIIAAAVIYTAETLLR